jgi:protein-disulfide isomerase
MARMPLGAWDLVAGTLLCTAVVFSMLAFMRRPSDPLQSGKPRIIANAPTYHAVGRSIGPEDARLKIVVWGDYYCPACRRFEAVLTQVRAANPDIAVLYRHWPLGRFPLSDIAAAAAECAGQQGRFEQMHRLLFAEPEVLTNGTVHAAERAGVADIEPFRQCMGSPRTKELIDADIEAVRALGGTGTPTIVVHDRLLVREVPDSARLSELVQQVF